MSHTACPEAGDHAAVPLEGPFSHLPTELLIEIFVLCSHSGGPLTPLDLGAVCRRWREVCISSPHVWQLIVVSTLSRSIPSIRSQAELWITRSAPLPFDVHVDLPDLCRLSPANFSHSSERLELQHLDVHLRTPVNAVGQVSMEITASYLPSRSLNPLHFTSLDISESYPLHAVQSPDLLSFLRGGRFNCFPPVIPLPRLHTLILDSTCIQRSILSHLHLPALRVLHLRQLNMDFSLHPHDFSQSPSSDHHTGMGMRKLISRSNPPLEILSMGLSDMRTKDFSWVFDRLSHLRQFAIPVTIGGGEGDLDGHPQEMRVRLPQLEILKLVSCQQFSGDALVDALTVRVRYTDAVTPDQSLTRVIIASCNGLQPNHEEELFWYLRDRLQVL
ncbi:hypothetical protein BKA82DRAFT_4152489 [Pisolithus tinctorius]|nr:hypothetical protein BKA82DRAFT_4152489 [Pisolithus tinctorius]